MAGEIEIPNLSDENEVEEVDVSHTPTRLTSNLTSPLLSHLRSLLSLSLTVGCGDS